MNNVINLDLNALITLCRQRLENIFSQYLTDIPAAQLKSAMEYTLKNGGKRLRPLLIYATGHIFNAPLDNLDIPAAAIELIHTYSLIHDDLPCMDNADLRRGKPTCHKVYGESMAVLTGDALHTLAMHIIANHKAPLLADNRLQMINILSSACGPFGMAAGQVLDITLMNDANISPSLLLDIYKFKTGALFSAALQLGRLAANEHSERNAVAIRQFGDAIGLAFQIQDDILDIEASTETLGKPQGIDADNKKFTYPTIHGLPAAKEKVENLYQQGLIAIQHLGERAEILRELTRFMLKRNN